MKYYTSYGKYEYPRTERECKECGEKKDIQKDCEICDECLVDKTIRGLKNGEVHRGSDDLLSDDRDSNSDSGESGGE